MNDRIIQETPVPMPAQPSSSRQPVTRTCARCKHTTTAVPIPRHRVYCGDSRDQASWDALLGGEKANVVVTSPPYASQRKYDESSGFRPIPPDEYGDWWDALQACVRDHLAGDGSFFVNIKEHCDSGQRHLYVKRLTIRMVDDWRWMFVDELCWVRAGVPGGWNNRFKNGWEPVFHFAIQGHIRFRPDAVSHESQHVFDYSRDNGKSVSGSGLLGKEHGERFHKGMARPSNVLEIGSGGAKVTGEHQAEYPVGLPLWFVLAYTDPGDMVVDCFLGSASTAIAAAETGRRSAGIEISPRYADICRRRLTRWLRAHGKDPGPGALEDPVPRNDAACVASTDEVESR